MDRMQKITLLCGIAVIVIMAVHPIKIHGHKFLLVPFCLGPLTAVFGLESLVEWSWGHLFLWSLIVALATFGLIYLQGIKRDEKPKADQKQ